MVRGQSYEDLCDSGKIVVEQLHRFTHEFINKWLEA